MCNETITVTKEQLRKVFRIFLDIGKKYGDVEYNDVDVTECVDAFCEIIRSETINESE